MNKEQKKNYYIAQILSDKEAAIKAKDVIINSLRAELKKEQSDKRLWEEENSRLLLKIKSLRKETVNV